MDKIVITGGQPLEGKISISGGKNAALPLLCAAILTEDDMVFENSPNSLADMESLKHLLEHLGCQVEFKGSTARINAGGIHHQTAPYEIVRKMRASLLVLGPLLARFGQATVSYPGGCAIGARPIDVTLSGLEALGAEITLDNGYVHAKVKNGQFQGTHFTLSVPSWTGTENLIMAAVFANGTTIFENVAREPEVVDLCNCLNAMGAKIEGAGTSVITIHGVSRLYGTTHKVMTDRLEAGTYAVAAAITGGRIHLDNTTHEVLHAFTEALQRAGTKTTPLENGMLVEGGYDIHPVDIITEPYPGFATDLQAQIMALMTLAKGTSLIKETIFENRFMHVPELNRMGANISIQGNIAVVRGVPKLQGAPVMATDLRASVSMVLAGLAAQGETVVNRIYHLDRGYERLDEKLKSCGARIRRISG
jgi:UDP-N-acetylglucosamine 1-carboxyvinyltransferase